MSIANLSPIAERNAIHSMICALEWDPLHRVSDVDKVHRQVLSELGDQFASEDVVSMTMRLPVSGMPSAAMMQPAQQKSGFILKNKAETNIITFAEDKILFQFNKYTRWHDTRSELEKYISVFFKYLGEKLPLLAFGQQVTDVFLWKDDPEKLDLSKVFKENCPLFSSALVHNKGLWHSYYGFSENNPILKQSEYIENINLSRVEKSGVHAIQLIQANRVKSKSPIYTGSMINPKDILEWNDRFHEKNKSNMKSIFTNEVLSKLDKFSI